MTQTSCTKHGIRLLLVEDNEINQMVASELLESQGYSVTLAETGIEAINHITKEPFDAVLMDCHMPVMDGYTATRQLRQIETENGLPGRGKTGTPIPMPVIAVTANAMKGDRERCLEAGMDAYVSKPVDPKALFSAIAALKPRFLAHEPAAAMTSNAETNMSNQQTPSPDTFDTPSLLSRCLDRPALALKVLAKFEESLPSLVEGLDSALAEKNLAEILRLSHTVKGTASNVSAVVLSKAAADLESTAKADNTLAQIESLAQQMKAIENELQRCLGDLPRVKQKLSVVS